MNQLIDQFDDLSVENNLIWYNNSSFDLYCLSKDTEDYVYTNSYIPKHEIIGYIEGIEKHTWEIIPDKYCIWFNDIYVIDCRKTPRCITSMIREGFFEGIPSNCCLKYSYMSESTVLYVEAIKDIYRGEELIIYKDY